MSAKRIDDVALLHKTIVAYFRKDLIEAEIFLPWAAQKLRGEIFSSCEVLEERSDVEGSFLRVRGAPDALQKLTDQLNPVQ